MDKIKLALQLLPVIRVLYSDGVIDIHGGSHPYIQIHEAMFKELFPDGERVGDNWVTYLDGVEIVAVAHDV